MPFSYIFTATQFEGRRSLHDTCHGHQNQRDGRRSSHDTSHGHQPKRRTGDEVDATPEPSLETDDETPTTPATDTSRSDERATKWERHLSHLHWIDERATKYWRHQSQLEHRCSICMGCVIVFPIGPKEIRHVYQTLNPSGQLVFFRMCKSRNTEKVPFLANEFFKNHTCEKTNFWL